MSTEFHLNSLDIDLSTSGFPNPEFWLKDLLALPYRFNPHLNKLFLSASVSDNVPEIDFPEVETQSEGKYFITWYGGDNPAVLWRSNDNTIVKQLGLTEMHSSLKMIKLLGTSENILGRWLRHFLIVPQYLNNSLFFLHAIAVSKNGKTFIVIGGSGAGKTTCAYSALRNGWKVLADDTLLLQPSLKIIPFFSTVSWECRLKMADKYAIDMMLPNAELYRSNLVSPLVDYKGRTIFFPQDHIDMSDNFDVTGIIWLYSAQNGTRKDNVISIQDIYDDLHRRISMKSIFDLYGENYFSWLSKMGTMYSNVLALPVYPMKYSGNLSQDTLNFLEMIEKL